MSADQLRAVECELSKKEVEARSLQSQLATCAQHVEEYKAIAKTVEEEFAHFKAAKEAEAEPAPVFTTHAVGEGLTCVGERGGSEA